MRGWLSGTIFQSSSNKKLSRWETDFVLHLSGAALTCMLVGCVVLCQTSGTTASFLTVCQWPTFWKSSCAESSEVVPKLCSFGVQLHSFVSGLIVTREEVLHPRYVFMCTLCCLLLFVKSCCHFFFSLVVFASKILPHTEPRRPVTVYTRLTLVWSSCNPQACKWKTGQCLPLSLDFLRKHTANVWRKPLLSWVLSFRLSSAFLSWIKRKIVSEVLLPPQLSTDTFRGLSENTPPESLLSSDSPALRATITAAGLHSVHISWPCVGCCTYVGRRRHRLVCLSKN